MKLVWVYIIILIGIITFWSVCGYVAYHFLTKYW